MYFKFIESVLPEQILKRKSYRSERFMVAFSYIDIRRCGVSATWKWIMFRFDCQLEGKFFY